MPDDFHATYPHFCYRKVYFGLPCSTHGREMINAYKICLKILRKESKALNLTLVMNFQVPQKVGNSWLAELLALEKVPCFMESVIQSDGWSVSQSVSQFSSLNSSSEM